MQTIGGGRYELEAEIATGAIGTVWRARDVRTGERVAAKLLRPEATEQPALVECFLAEARILLELAHPCVVRARELVQVGSRYALVLDLVNGQDLRRRLRSDGPLPPAVAVDVVAQIADALAYLHGTGVVHGDVKPGNILVPVDGSPVRLTDFGVARRLTDPTQGRATHATPEYVAPEVIGGAPPRPSTDVYALGIVLYELLCGRTPYRGGAASEVLYRHISCMPVPPAGFPEAVWPLVVACLAGNPDDRPAAATLAHQLRTVQSSLGALAPLPATGPDTVTWRPREDTLVVPAPIPYETTVPARGTRRRALLAGMVGAAALLVLLAGLGVVLMLHGNGSGGPATHPVAVVSPQTSPSAATPAPKGSSPKAPNASSPAPKPSTPPATTDPTDGTDTGNDRTPDNTPDTQPPAAPLLPGMGSQLPTFPGN